MGAENSKSNAQRTREDDEARIDREVKRALEIQKQMYEQKCKELRQAQRLKDQNAVNGNQVPNNSAVDEKVTSTPTATLYPSLSDTTNNNIQPAAYYAKPSNSQRQMPSNTLHCPVLPTAPLEEPAEVVFTTTARFKEQAEPGHNHKLNNRLEPQRHFVNQPQAIPSTSSKNATPEGQNSTNAKLICQNSTNARLVGQNSTNAMSVGQNSSNAKLVGQNSTNAKSVGPNSSNARLVGQNSTNDKSVGQNSSNARLVGQNSTNDKSVGQNSSNARLVGLKIIFRLEPQRHFVNQPQAIPSTSSKNATSEGQNSTNAKLICQNSTNARLVGQNSTNAMSVGQNSSNARLVGQNSTNDKSVGQNSSNARLLGQNSTNAKSVGPNSSNARLVGQNSTNDKSVGQNSSNARLVGQNSTNAKSVGPNSSNARLVGQNSTNAMLVGQNSTNARLVGQNSTFARPVEQKSTNAQLVGQKPQETRNGARKKASPSFVQCATSSNELGPQIYQCKNGHSSWWDCRFGGARCGVCTEPIADMRNIALETSAIADLKLKEINEASLMKVKCPNSADGCRLSMKSNEIEDHLKECPYREMACPLAAIFGCCSWTGRITQIKAHFSEMHLEHYQADVDKEMYLLNINVNHKIVHLVNIGTFTFVVHIQVDVDNRAICMTVQTLGTKVSASKWSYELHVYNKRVPRMKYKYVDTCISSSESVNEIFRQQKCAVLNTEYAKNFLNNNQLTYKFYIKKDFHPNSNQHKRNTWENSSG